MEAVVNNARARTSNRCAAFFQLLLTDRFDPRRLQPWAIAAFSGGDLPDGPQGRTVGIMARHFSAHLRAIPMYPLGCLKFARTSLEHTPLG